MKLVSKYYYPTLNTYKRLKTDKALTMNTLSKNTSKMYNEDY